MIPIFRKTRKKMADDNRPLKYLRYGIGEIVLVVIGILIALQINNWNESNQTRIYETKMLIEIDKALDNDLNHFKRMMGRLERLDSITNSFITDIHNLKKEFTDSLYNNGYSRWYGLRTGILYQYNPGPYEALKSSGLDKLTNDSLRNSLIEFYDFHFPYNEELVAFADRQYEDDMTVLESFLNLPYTERVDGKVVVLRKFPKDLYQNKEFLELLRNMKSRAQITHSYLKNHVSRMKKISDQLKTELNK